MHNIQNPEAAYSKDIVDHPLSLLYHISKPIKYTNQYGCEVNYIYADICITLHTTTTNMRI